MASQSYGGFNNSSLEKGEFFRHLQLWTVPIPENLIDGFQINLVVIKDFDTDEILFTGTDDYSNSKEVFEVHLPKKILQCRAVIREMHFMTIKGWEHLRIVQTAFYKGKAMDQTEFNVGPISPLSSNIHHQVIQAAPECQMLPAEIVSGQIEVVSDFYNGDQLITQTKKKLFYD